MRLRASRVFKVEPTLPARLEPLRALAQNLHWTWNTDAAALFQRVDPALWDASDHNPVRVLQRTPAGNLAALADDADFLAHLDRVDGAFREYMARPSRLQVANTSESEVIAYFSLEFALTESLPTYSGGLGVLAGDHLKSASDLGLPLVGVTLLYREGYFLQALGPDGWQQEEYAEIDVGSQPLRRVRDANGAPLTISVPFEGRDVVASIWQIDVGQVRLFLLDTALERNSAADRDLTTRLYGGDIEMRIQQEMLVGIGGVRALAAMGIRPAVCHMNEGHSALLGLERIRMLMEESGVRFEEARLPVTAATTFTTHTAVAAGIDLFPAELVTQQLGRYYEAMGLDAHTFIGLGRTNPDDESEPFSMALLGLRLSGYRNGVSKLHRSVSRRLWESAWPQLPLDEIPLQSITNGVHLPTWVAHDMGDLYDRHLGREWRDDPACAKRWDPIQSIPDEELWEAHQRQRRRLIERARVEHAEGLARREGAPFPDSGRTLSPDVLTVGFARRFAAYKRSTLLFRDVPRLARIVNNAERPVQFVFAGKAHPRDEPAKQLIREVLQYSLLPEFRDRLILLERYDIELARSLVQGCDVWLNTPLRPLEASGTSGMKAAANGALHMSVLDGWWWEAYQPGIGWAIGRNRPEDDPELQDALDAASLYELLESEVTGSFYDRDEAGVPRDWVRRMKASIQHCAPRFNTTRMVAEYASEAYVPAAASWRRLRADDLAPARELAAWLQRVTASWDAVKVLAVDDDSQDDLPAGANVNVVAQVHLGPLSSDDITVDLLHGPTEANGTLRGELSTRMSLESRADDGTCRYVGAFAPGGGGSIGYAIRLLPDHPGQHSPFATGLARWA